MPLSEAQMKQKMAKSVARKSLGSNLIPAGIGSQPIPEPSSKEGDEVVPHIADMIADDEDVQTIISLASHYKGQSQIEGQAKKAKEDDGKRLKSILGKYGIAKAICDQFKVTITPGHRSTIDPIKLLAQGVSQVTINLCTDTTDTSTINVTQVKK
jgi:hypothetical protein